MDIVVLIRTKLRKGAGAGAKAITRDKTILAFRIFGSKDSMPLTQLPYLALLNLYIVVVLLVLVVVLVVVMEENVF